MSAADEFTLRDMLHRAARWYPDNEAAVDVGQRYTYRRLLDRVLRMAALYHSMGVRKGDRIALMLYPSANHPIALFGAIELGAIPAALHVRESPAVLADVLRRLSPRVLVYDGALDATVDQIRSLVSTITGYVRARSDLTEPSKAISGSDTLIPDDLDRYEMDFEPMALSASEPAVIVLSSGTTGTPKAVIHSHRTLMESARGGVYIWRCQPGDAIVNMLTTSFIGWYNLSLPYFNVGAKNVYMSRYDPMTYLQVLQDERGTLAFLIPTMWRMLLRQELGAFDLSHVRLAGFAGEVMDQVTLAQVREKISSHVINIYGTTETGSCSGGTIMFEEDMLREGKLASVGKPLLNADVRVIRPGGTVADEVAPGELGEVIISGPSVASEVWDDPATARRIFEGKWWHSGDLGRIDADGYLFLEGRTDDMIISGGINISPAHVEEVLLAHPGIAEVAVVGAPHEVWGQQVYAFVVRKDEGVTEVGLDAFVKASDLSQYQRPRVYIFLDTLPKTSTGKLNRKALREAKTIVTIQVDAE